MNEFIMANENGRTIPKEDKIFGISNRANKMIAEKGADNVINGTIGALLDDEGKLMVLSSVDKAFKNLNPVEYAAYAPIGGIEAYKEAVLKATLGSFKPKGYVRVVATPGGTGALRNAVANYSDAGDGILTTDWHWSPYGTIAGEQGRYIEVFEMFDSERNFNVKALRDKAQEILKKQDRLLIILNTPAHNPTGYSIRDEEWDEVVESLNGLDSSKKIALVVDSAYIDFAGDEEEYRSFLPKLENINSNIISLIASSMSKTFTLYGMRTGAIICLSADEEVAEEFRRCCEYSSRASWSNSPKAGQSLIANIFADESLREAVTKEREEIRNVLLRRGEAFSSAAEEAGLDMLKYDGGFFVSLPHPNPDRVTSELEKRGIFLVPLAKGVRVSIASISESRCREIPKVIKEVMDSLL